MLLTSIWLKYWLVIRLTFLINTAKHIMLETFSAIKIFESDFLRQEEEEYGVNIYDISLHFSTCSLMCSYDINSFRPMTTFCVVQNELGRSSYDITRGSTKSFKPYQVKLSRKSIQMFPYSSLFDEPTYEIDSTNFQQTCRKIYMRFLL